MARTFVKICGITRVEDAVVAARFGADFIGMVLHADSPRMISPERAWEIVAALPASAVPVALFVDAPAPTILGTCRAIGITHVQLHGRETPDDVASLTPLVCWKMIRVDGQLPEQLRLWSGSRASALVLETAGVTGGSGRENDWRAIASARGALASAPHLVAAGGLTPGNVGEVIRRLRPWSVDVSSGVEGPTRGVKSHEKLDSFIRAVRAADESI